PGVRAEGLGGAVQPADVWLRAELRDVGGKNGVGKFRARDESALRAVRQLFGVWHGGDPGNESEGGRFVEGPFLAVARGAGRKARAGARAMTTLVTGAAGFLGSHVARQLVARGDEVRVLMRPSSSNRAISDLSLEYVTGDLRDTASLERAMNGVQRVFHVAADYRLWAKHSKEIYDSNVGGTKNVLAAAKKACVQQFIYTSTVATIAVDRPAPP